MLIHLRKTSKCLFLILKKATHSIISFKDQTDEIWCHRIYPKTYIHPFSVCFKYLVYKSVNALSFHHEYTIHIQNMDWIDSIYSCEVFVTYNIKLWIFPLSHPDFFVFYATCSLRMSEHTVIYCCDASWCRASSPGTYRSHILVYLKIMAALFSKVRAYNMGLRHGYYMTSCYRTTTGVIHPRANNWMFLVKQRFPVVQRGANRCLYWSQVYIMC